MSKPKISIIIPVHNNANELSRCLQSVINQTLKDIEIICVDDGSADESVDILKYFGEIDERVKVITQANKGVSVARNTGLKHSVGDYIMFSDSDDFYEKNTCEEAYNQIVSTNSDVVMFESKIHKNGKISDNFTNDLIRKNHLINYTENYKEEDRFVFTSYIWDKIYSAKFLKDNNIFFPENIIAAEDHVFNLTVILNRAKLNLLNKALYNYTQNNKPPKRTKYEIKNIFNAYRILFDNNKFKNLSDNEKLKYYEHYLKVITDAYTNYPAYQIVFIPQIKTALDNLKKHLRGSELKTLKNYKKLSKICAKYYWEHVFSLKNISAKHKQLCIGGIKIRFRRNKKKNSNQVHNEIIQPIENLTFVQNFLNHEIKENTVLLIEQNNCHGECLYGMCNYFLNLGFNVDILISKKEAELFPLYKINDSHCNIFKVNKFILKEILSHPMLNRYRYIYLNSDYCYFDASMTKIDEFLQYTCVPEKKFIRMIHHLDLLNNEDYDNKKMICISPMPCINGTNIKVVNTHFSVEKANYTKNKTANFIVIGNIENQRKNFKLLSDTVRDLKNRNIRNFKITVIARVGKLKIDEDIKMFFDFKGQLNYPDMYKELENADFILTLLDPENTEHERYCLVGTSGSFQLSYGFRKPCLIAEKFTAVPGFNPDNAIVYSKNSDFINAVEYAINMDENTYGKLVENLDTLEKRIYNSSLENLKSVLYEKSPVRV